MKEKYFITGIGTGVGKTLISAVLTDALEADYWKPIQAGNLNDSDSLWVLEHIHNKKSKIHPECFKLNYPLSPHHAAALDKVSISLNDFKVPETKNTLVIEGAGGLMVPLNENEFVKDLIKHLKAEVILVCSDYLGCINHSLSAFTVLQHYKIPVKGIVLNGFGNLASRDSIVQHSPWPVILEYPKIQDISTFNTLTHIKQVRL